ncbi:MAG: hypothetical protein JNN08_27450, partial [Bryobacterales bacterium]|nr:hypothetical protein [Bryobacterales bacterium]
GWRPIAQLEPQVQTKHDTADNVLCWLMGCVFVYGALFGVGKLFFGENLLGLAFLAGSAASATILYRNLARRGWSSAIE